MSHPPCHLRLISVHEEIKILQIWGDNSDDENDDDIPENDAENDDGRGETMGEKEWGAKDERTREYEEETEDTNNDKIPEKEINEMDDLEKDDDHIDPYHGKLFFFS